LLYIIGYYGEKLNKKRHTAHGTSWKTVQGTRWLKLQDWVLRTGDWGSKARSCWPWGALRTFISHRVHRELRGFLLKIF